MIRTLLVLGLFAFLVTGCQLPGIGNNLPTALPQEPSPTPEPPTPDPATPVYVVRPVIAAADPSTNVAVEEIAGLYSQNLQNTRTVRVYLPPGYANSTTRYPVLYLNDGQDSAGLGIKKLVEFMASAQTIQPPIIVAIYATDDRVLEYGVSGQAAVQNIGLHAEAYSRFVVDELIPIINRQYRTLTGAEHTSLLGSSLGGLSAFDIAWHHPAVFGRVGAMSGSFWVRPETGDSPEERQAARLMHQVVRQGPMRPGLKFWFEAGTNDEVADRDSNGVIDAIQDTTELIDELVALGYDRDRDIVYYQVEGGQHNTITWSQSLPEFLLWAYGQ